MVMELAAKDATLLQAPSESPTSQGEEIFNTSVAQYSRWLFPNHPKPRHSSSYVSAALTCYRGGDFIHCASICKFKDVILFSLQKDQSCQTCSLQLRSPQSLPQKEDLNRHFIQMQWRWTVGWIGGSNTTHFVGSFPVCSNLQVLGLGRLLNSSHIYNASLWSSPLCRPFLLPGYHLPQV